MSSPNKQRRICGQIFASFAIRTYKNVFPKEAGVCVYKQPACSFILWVGVFNKINDVKIMMKIPKRLYNLSLMLLNKIPFGFPSMKGINLFLKSRFLLS